MGGGKRNQVAPCGTADFEYPCGVHVGGVQPEEMGDRGQVSRRRLRKGIRGVRRGVVVGPKLVDGIVDAVVSRSRQCPSPDRNTLATRHSITVLAGPGEPPTVRSR